MTGSGAIQIDYLTNEPVEGELLADKLAAAAVAPAEALDLGVEIATALGQAHARGLIHGSISPFTVVVGADRVHILQPSESPDERGAPYRSPEQVRGERPDVLSDIFAFGAVLYEVCTGRRAFEGEGADLDRAILEESPPRLLGPSPAETTLENVIASCLDKDTATRRQRIQNAALELRLASRSLRRASLAREAQENAALPLPPSIETEAPAPDRVEEPATAPPQVEIIRQTPRIWYGVLAIAILGVAVSAYLAWLLLRPAKPASGLALAMSPLEHAGYRSTPVASPDGRMLTYAADGPGGQPVLWLRPLDTLRASPIDGTEGAASPFWSPDGKAIAFFAGGALRRVEVSDLSVKTICPADAPAAGGSWSAAGTILFAAGSGAGLMRVSAQGGKPETVMRPDLSKSELYYLWPQFLPGQDWFLFFVLTTSKESTGLYLGALDGNQRRMILPCDTNAGYFETTGKRRGYLLYIRERNLMAQGFDTATFSLRERPVMLAEDLAGTSSLSAAAMTVSSHAILVGQQVEQAERRLAWMGRDGKASAAVKTSGEWGPPRIVPGGRRAIAALRRATADAAGDLWWISPDGATTQFTNTKDLDERNPVWTPSGGWVGYAAANREKGYDLFVMATEGGKPARLYTSPSESYPTDWIKDGRFVILSVLGQNTRHDIWAFSIADRKPVPVIATAADEISAAVSPDGRWVAFGSDESGRSEVYVAPFQPGVAGVKQRWKASQGGGGMPRWRGDGKELFYVTSSGNLMSVNIQATGAEVSFAPPQTLFQTGTAAGRWNCFDVSADGQTFLMNLPAEGQRTAQIAIVTNWVDKLP